jgi:hypothetical protein
MIRAEKITTQQKNAEHMTENKKIKFTRNIQCNELARRWLWLIPIPPLDEALPQQQERIECTPSRFPFRTPSNRYCGASIESPFSASEVKSPVSSVVLQHNMRVDSLFILSSHRWWVDIAWTSGRLRRWIEKEMSFRRDEICKENFRKQHQHLPIGYLQSQSGLALFDFVHFSVTYHYSSDSLVL